MQSFTTYIPLLTATSAFGLGRRRWSSPQQCNLHCLCTLYHYRYSTLRAEEFRNSRNWLHSGCDVLVDCVESGKECCADPRDVGQVIRGAECLECADSQCELVNPRQLRTPHANELMLQADEQVVHGILQLHQLNIRLMTPH